MKLIYIFLFTLSIFSCQTTKDSGKFSSGDLEIIKAYHQKWFGGRPGVAGTYYKVELNQVKEGKVAFDSMFVKNQWQPAILEAENPFVVMASITDPRPTESQDVFDLSNGGNTPVTESTESTEINKAFEGKNILAYSIDGEPKLMEIGEFKREESKMYP